MLPSTPLGVAAQFTDAPSASVVTAAPTGQNEVGSNQSLVSIPPRRLKGAVWIGTCVVPFAASEVPLAVNRNGTPLLRERLPLTPQPPMTQLPRPECIQRLPCPNGSSYTKLCTNVCSRPRGPRTE